MVVAQKTALVKLDLCQFVRIAQDPACTTALSDKSLFKSQACSRTVQSEVVRPDTLSFGARSFGLPQRGLAICGILGVEIERQIWPFLKLRLMPVAKESFHAWQNMAAAMYDKAEDAFKQTKLKVLTTPCHVMR